MAYTKNVPQSSQQQATTQPIIQANFTFIGNGLPVDHNYNAAGTGTDLYHLQCQMPNQADLASLVAGTNGGYYVNGGWPKYYNGNQVGGLFLCPMNAFIQFSGNGSNGVLTGGGNSIRASYNINSATTTKTATGLYTISFTNTLPSANYLVLMTGMRADAGEVFGFVQSDATYAHNQTTTFVNIGFESSSGTPRNVIMGSVMIFGA